MYEFYDEYPIDETEDEEYNTFSATDMTGLIPRGELSEEEYDAYEDVYPYVNE
ncbi:MAG: hypothetical protein VZR54_03540 [Ruminococcus sp.]|jgi:hypothetical protein|nr:hypothetical protein [Ruminococcus sp.]